MSEVTSFTQCSLGGKILPDRTNSTELVVAGYGGLTDDVLHGQCAAQENAESFERVRERDVVRSS